MINQEHFQELFSIFSVEEINYDLMIIYHNTKTDGYYILDWYDLDLDYKDVYLLYKINLEDLKRYMNLEITIKELFLISENEECYEIKIGKYMFTWLNIKQVSKLENIKRLSNYYFVEDECSDVEKKKTFIEKKIRLKKIKKII